MSTFIAHFYPRIPKLCRVQVKMPSGSSEIKDVNLMDIDVSAIQEGLGKWLKKI